MKLISFLLKTSFIIAAFFVSIEAILQLTALFISERSPAITPGEASQIWVLGESTSAWGGNKSYPSLLQKLINDKFPDKKIEVVTLARTSSNSRKQLEELKSKLKIKTPKMIIAMLGINDSWALKWDEKNQERHENLWKFRSYRLFYLIYVNYFEKEAEHKSILIDWKPQSPIEGKLDSNEMLKISSLIHDKNITEVEKIIHSSPEITKRSDYFFFASEQIVKQFGETNRWALKTQRRLLKNCLKENPEYIDCIEKLIYCQLTLTVPLSEQKKYLKFVLNNTPKYSNTYFALATLLSGSPQQNEVILKIENFLKKYPVREYFLWEKFIHLLRTAKSTEKLAYWENIFISEFGPAGYAQNIKSYNQLREQFHLHPQFRRNFLEILDIASRNNVKFVSTQYPFLPNVGLKKLAQNSEDIIWVENIENFEKALKENSFGDLFIDHFSKSFGHFTEKGAQIIAENIFQAIEPELSRYP